MGQRTCTADDCDGPHEARGLCNSHYRRALRSGSLKKLPPTTEPERFWQKVNVEGVCWEWESALNTSGYGHFRSRGRNVLAHRWSYEHLVGQIPEGLQIDHLCKNIRCVLPDHLEPVTPQINTHRSSRAALQVAITHCPSGHPYSGENLYRIPPSATAAGSRRSCRECSRAANRRWYQRNREAQVERSRLTKERQRLLRAAA